MCLARFLRQFLLQRRLQSAGIAIVISLIVFCFVHASGDPAALLVPEQATPAAAAPYNPRLGRLADRHKPPGYVDATGGVHWPGTDDQGRDVLSRVIYGAQVSLKVSYTGVIMGALIGIAIGIPAGVVEGHIEAFRNTRP